MAPSPRPRAAARLCLLGLKVGQDWGCKNGQQAEMQTLHSAQCRDGRNARRISPMSLGERTVPGSKSGTVETTALGSWVGTVMKTYNNSFLRPVLCKFRRTIRVGRLEIQERQYICVGQLASLQPVSIPADALARPWCPLSGAGLLCHFSSL